ncbi:class I SAM-dependent DNA methyltransferase [Lentzea sp. BCCO 10_0061]|uniref:site-specific DNA-methyltransferase (adenine-specific) n=1 Tax=Lentzea sokolovensis TaxID=3095429 RepID=A0ABU4UZT7_9PSEU|nr:class I SAM-dependent DNA methyltransferase [Lentzea sp. BCCO 10_0061]MDX8145017.1 class I SAM-dependent DNA methyltransferase [Lentzea sp. BCCO 10_0061]
MSASDAILISGDWISEHYFTTDATAQSFRAQALGRRKEWDSHQDTGSVRSRFVATRGSLLSRMTSLEDDAGLATEIHKDLIDVLGFNALGLTSTVSGPVTFVRQVSLPDGPTVALVAAKPIETAEQLLDRETATLAEPYDVDDTSQLHSVSKLLSTLFVSEDSPDFALVLAGRVALIAERERWPEGRYLTIDLQLVCERNDDKKGGETDLALTCLSADSLAPDAEGSIWWHAALDESIKHTVGVSRDLREGVRLSIEIIANDVVTRRKSLGLDPLPPAEAQPLAKQSLRFLYRILFLLYAEASPELGVLPTGAPEYEQGYSLDRLRDLIQTSLTSPRAEIGTHLYESLAVLFRLVDEGYTPAEVREDEGLLQALTFRSLKADLFRPEAIALINEVKLGNANLQRVLQHLLLSKEKKGSDRGFISYAELGINQLGAVYEGLMSYTGRFAETDLYEVAKGGDGAKGSWLVPVDRASSIDDKDFVRYEDPITSERKPVLHLKGTFVFRLAGRERQQSASYYTPEVLTRFTVGQALEELLDQDDTATPAEEILSLTVCEPALGSGAFAIEAVRQLATEYLSRRQDELGVRIEPEDYPKELQKVKAYLALHNVYGVDLNSTAVELAEISLWLDTMTAGLQAPWFGLHLRRGNSLIGARHAVFSRLQMEKKTWLKDAPRAISLTELPDDVRAGRESAAGGQIHHFLLPADGWGSAINAKEAKQLGSEALDKLKRWRKEVLVKPSKLQIDTLVGLGRRVEALWQLAWRRLTIAESEIRRSIDVWGAEGLTVGGAVSREQIEESLADPNGAYQRLRRVMDAWCAMWFWPLTEATAPPSLDEWIETLRGLLGRVGKVKKAQESQLSLASAATWKDLSTAEESDLGFAMAVDVTKLLDEHPWLAAAERVAAQQGFFHWELTFAPIFAQGGFDLQVGNPPWVRPRSDVEALLAEADPWWQLKSKSTADEDKTHREFALSIDGARELVLDGTTDIAATAAFVGAAQHYPHLVGLQPDLYRCFMEHTWRTAKPTGSVGLIHLESHFTDEKAGLLRAETYRRLRRHWQFINELKLFEIQDQKRFGINVYGGSREPYFLQAASLYHPDTVVRSIKHDGSGVEPGIKDLDGNWDVRPHASRIIVVTQETLGSWHAVLETDDVPVRQTRMVYTVNRSTATVLEKVAAAPRFSSLALQFSPGWHEKNDRGKGFFDAEWGVPESWDQVVLQGSHLGVARPFYKTPNESMLHNTDWTEVDLEDLAPDAVPVTSYKPRGDRGKYDAAYTHWTSKPEGSVIAARDHFRLAWRNMAANTGERTLIPALIPPGAAHIHTVSAVGLPGDAGSLTMAAGFTSSLIHDFAVRSAPKSTISASTLNRLPFTNNDFFRPLILLRVLRLNCLTDAYADLWSDCFDDAFFGDKWTGGLDYSGRPDLAQVDVLWSAGVPLRRAVDRRQALLELDVLVAMSLGIEIKELCTIYRTQFPVLYGYDQRSQFYDAMGRLVPSSIVSEWRKCATRSSTELLRARHAGSGVEHEFVPPLLVLDREADMQVAFADFQDRLVTRRMNSA